MKEYCIESSYTINEAIERIDSTKNRVVIVMNAENRVIGVVSQGDIIRALSEGKNLYTRVEMIVRPNFFYIESKDIEEAYKIFKKYHITLLPVLDGDYHLVDIITMNDIYEYMEEKCKN